MYKLLLLFLVLTKNILSDIIITAPHSMCVPVEGRTCDSVGNKAAKMLAKKFDSPFTFFATHYREDTDLNREEARVTLYRTELRELLKRCRESRLNCVLFDIHSFPPEELKGKEIQGVKIKKIPDLYFLKAFYDNHLARYLSTYMSKQDIATYTLDASYDNDILLEANYFLIPGVIIEFNEELSDKRLEQIVDILAQGILDYTRGVEQPVEKVTTWKDYIIQVAIIILTIVLFFLWFFFRTKKR